MAVRRVCPQCGTGINAPERPRRDDVRRYCLTCSAKTGRLVERVAPTLEKQRTAQAERAAAKRLAKARKAKEKENAYYTVAGVDLRKETARILKAPSIHLWRAPEIKVVRCTRTPTVFGRAWPGEHRILINAYPGIDEHDVRETLTHELVHLFVGGDRSDRAHWHGERFQRTMREVFRETYGLTPLGSRVTAYHGRYSRALREKSRPGESNS